MLTDSSVQRCCQSLFLVEVVSLVQTGTKIRKHFQKTYFSVFLMSTKVSNSRCVMIYGCKVALCAKRHFITHICTVFFMQLGTRFQFIPLELKLNQIPSPKSCHIKTFAIMHFARTFAVTTTIKALYMTLSCNISLEFHFNLSFSR